MFYFFAFSPNANSSSKEFINNDFSFIPNSFLLQQKEKIWWEKEKKMFKENRSDLTDRKQNSNLIYKNFLLNNCIPSALFSNQVE